MQCFALDQSKLFKNGLCRERNTLKWRILENQIITPLLFLMLKTFLFHKNKTHFQSHKTTTEIQALLIVLFVAFPLLKCDKCLSCIIKATDKTCKSNRYGSDFLLHYVLYLPVSFLLRRFLLVHDLIRQ